MSHFSFHSVVQFANDYGTNLTRIKLIDSKTSIFLAVGRLERIDGDKETDEIKRATLGKDIFNRFFFKFAKISQCMDLISDILLSDSMDN